MSRIATARGTGLVLLRLHHRRGARRRVVESTVGATDPRGEEVLHGSDARVDMTTEIEIGTETVVAVVAHDRVAGPEGDAAGRTDPTRVIDVIRAEADENPAETEAIARAAIRLVILTEAVATGARSAETMGTGGGTGRRRALEAGTERGLVVASVVESKAGAQAYVLLTELKIMAIERIVKDHKVKIVQRTSPRQ